MAAVKLADGRVLVAGGDDSGAPTSSIEIYDPNAGGFTETDYMKVAREGATACLLADTGVLIVGGIDDSGMADDTAEVYDPSVGAVTSMVQLGDVRDHSTATTLSDGSVLIAGWLRR